MRCIALWVTLSLTSAATAQPGPKPTPKPPVAKPSPGQPPPEEQTIIVGKGLLSAGKLHTPNLLYFLERANEELERASLEKRSFIPKLARSLDEEPL